MRYRRGATIATGVEATDSCKKRRTRYSTNREPHSKNCVDNSELWRVFRTSTNQSLLPFSGISEIAVQQLSIAFNLNQGLRRSGTINGKAQ